MESFYKGIPQEILSKDENPNQGLGRFVPSS
jgi:hypothetical protein